MAAKKKTSTTPAAGLRTLKIGSRVRCTDDHIEGRIVWANGVSVKITWNDGEQVTWRRDSVADRPIEILRDDEDQAAAAAAEQPEPAQAADETAPEATTIAPIAPTPELEAATDMQPPAPDPTETSTEPEAATKAPTAADEPTESDAATEEPPTPATNATAGPFEAAAPSEPAQAASKPKRQRKAPAEPQTKKLSALDAAAKILAETRTPMTCQELISAMAVKGYWTSPEGETPSATLYSAIQRDIATKGDRARFTKTERGKFGLAVRG